MNKATHVKAWLETKPVGTTFTSVEIAEALALSHGAVTGYLARAQRFGSVAVADRSHRPWTWALVDPAKLHESTRRSAGGAEGRRIRRTPAPPSFELIQDRLLELAEELDSVRTPLAVYTIEELLAEIATRARGDA